MNKLRTLTIISSIGSIFVVLGFIAKVSTLFQLIFLVIGIALTFSGLIGLIKHMMRS